MDDDQKKNPLLYLFSIGFIVFVFFIGTWLLSTFFADHFQYKNKAYGLFSFSNYFINNQNLQFYKYNSELTQSILQKYEKLSESLIKFQKNHKRVPKNLSFQEKNFILNFKNLQFSLNQIHWQLQKQLQKSVFPNPPAKGNVFWLYQGHWQFINPIQMVTIANIDEKIVDQLNMYNQNIQKLVQMILPHILKSNVDPIPHLSYSDFQQIQKQQSQVLFHRTGLSDVDLLTPQDNPGGISGHLTWIDYFFIDLFICSLFLLVYYFFPSYLSLSSFAYLVGINLFFMTWVFILDMFTQQGNSFLFFLFPSALFALSLSYRFPTKMNYLFGLLWACFFWGLQDYSVLDFFFVVMSVYLVFWLNPVQKISSLKDYILCCFYLFFSQWVCYIVFLLLISRLLDISFILNGCYYAIYTLLCVFVYQVVIQFLEYLFPTLNLNKQLLPLLQVTHPLLQQLRQQAQGTYLHSLEVGNMVELGAHALQANTLLAKVGGYYHDIGKIERAEYFIENQGKDNPHDHLDAYSSVSIIKAHVDLGLKKTRYYNFPKQVQNIIKNHHGHSLIQYFYQKALEQSPHFPVNKENFCYNGETPHTVEQVIVLLADTVEAASRTWQVNSLEEINDKVSQLFWNKVQAKLLKQCPLTVKQIAILQKVFSDYLWAKMHHRSDYIYENI